MDGEQKNVNRFYGIFVKFVSITFLLDQYTKSDQTVSGIATTDNNKHTNDHHKKNERCNVEKPWEVSGLEHSRFRTTKYGN